MSMPTLPTSGLSTLIEVLRQRAKQQDHLPAIRFLCQSDNCEEHLSYAELDRRARAIAALLQGQKMERGRALLLYPPGLEFIAAFFGCLYAGITAVPAYPPRPNKPLPRLQTIAEDAGAALVLTTGNLLADLERRLLHAPYLQRLPWLATDQLPVQSEDAWKDPGVRGDTLAFLQYTSGSTAAPRGVMVSHSNLLHNMRVVYRCFEMAPTVHMVSWLPPYHDMGLISILVTVHGGFPLTLMAPATFLQRPLRWLQAISRVRGTMSGAPNFAFDLCTRTISAQERAHLDLSSWDLAFVAAEPIRHETLERFTNAFASSGFRRTSFYPCYGLAEATVFVAGGPKVSPWLALPLQRADLEKNKVVPVVGAGEGARLVVGCGQIPPEHPVRIVDPQTRTCCADSEIGEIWVSGPSIAQGYWARPDETEQTFRAYLADSGEGPFLRTGDLGFCRDGEIFVTGRLKELIIIRGRKHYPPDIEWTVEQSHPALRSAGVAAFAVDREGAEHLVLVAEVERTSRPADLDEVTQAIHQAVLEYHEVEVSAIQLLRTGTLPKTSSGKVAHHACRDGFVRGCLAVVKEWTLPCDRDDAEGDSAPPPARKQSPTVEVIQEWLVLRLRDKLGRAAKDIDVREPFASWGLDSAAAVSITGELESWLGRRLSPTLVYEYPTVELLAAYLGEDRAEPKRPTLTPDNQVVQPEAVAIIGIGCRFPNAADPATFWRLLCDGVDTVREAPPARADLTAPYDPDPDTPGTMNTRWGGFLEQVDQFDPHFFGISAREAMRMDPQQRLLLEVAWEALEDAGLAVERLAGSRTGVFIGISNNEYGELQRRVPALLDGYWSTGNAWSIAANRLSYLWDFRGPSLAIDTACSSSLVAVHLACSSLARGEITLALVGGVNLILSPMTTISFTKGRALASDGRCKAFDARANGVVRGEGAGVVVLKPLSQALCDRDPIYAVIRGSAVNQDGRSNGLTAPNGAAQEQVLRQAYRNAGISPSRVQYIEAHGTGTLLGDPIEAKALGAVLAAGRDRSQPCAVGSVKSNMGHLEAAAGIASLIKAALAIRHRQIPPSLHFHEPSPHIPFRELLLYVPQTLQPWPAASHPALAGVNAFGFGGTNAHVVLEEAPVSSPTQRSGGEPVPGRDYLIPLSARSPEALRALAQTYSEALRAHGPASLGSLADLCYTRGVRRSHHSHRLSVVARSGQELAEHLGAFVRGQVVSTLSSHCRSSDRPVRVVFVFSGQGSQWHGMGRQLLDKEPVFRTAFAECDRLFREQGGVSPLEELTDETKRRWGDQDVHIAQPVLFALQAALKALWTSWGIEPDAVVGHSMGEAAAAYAAGALNLADAVPVIYHRSRVMQEGMRLVADPGAMAVVQLALPDAQRTLAGYEGRLSIAAHNSPGSVVLSGEAIALREVLGKLSQRKVLCRLLPVPGAGHSPQMDLVKDDLVRSLQGLTPRPAAVPLYSTVTGKTCAGQDLNAAYWGQNLRQPVLFAEAISGLAADGYDVFVELSPHPLLARSITQCLRHLGGKAVVLPSLRREEDERSVMLASLGELYTHGHAVAWERLEPEGGACVRLPPYPWQRQRYWFEESAAINGHPIATSSLLQNGRKEDRQPLPLQYWKSAVHAGTHFWQTELGARGRSHLGDDPIEGKILVPTSVYLELALSAAVRLFGPESPVLEKVDLTRALFLPEENAPTLQLVVSEINSGEASFQLFSFPPSVAREQAESTLHVVGSMRKEQYEPDETRSHLGALSSIQTRFPEIISAEQFYRHLQEMGMQYGSGYRGVSQVWRGDGEALGQLCLSDDVMSEFGTYPSCSPLLDSCFQVLAAAVSPDDVRLAAGEIYVPVGLQKLRLCNRVKRGKSLWAYARLHAEAQVDAAIEGDVLLFDQEGNTILVVTRLRFQPLDCINPAAPDNWVYELTWEALGFASRRNAALAPGAWIIFNDDKGLGDALASRLEACGETCFMVSPGETHQPLGSHRFQLNPGCRADFQWLVRELLNPDRPPCRGMIHLWSLNSPDATATTLASLQDAQLRGCGSVLHLVQALTEQQSPRSECLWLVTRGAQTSGGGETPVAFPQAPLWGLGRTLRQEHPELKCKLVDLDPLDPEAGAALFQELAVADGEDQILLRREGRFAARLRSVPPEQARTLTETRFDPESSYLITGGLGGIGLALARWMVQQGARHLALTGRKAPSPAAEEVIHDLRSTGAGITVFQADVIQEREVAELLTAIDRSLPPLRGVFHAAGVLDDDLLVHLDYHRFQTVMAPKVCGAWNLHAQTLHRRLETFVFFSSAAALLGPPGMGGYPAANAFLDALALDRHARGLPALSVNWAAWTNLGMAAPAQRQRHAALPGLGSIPPEAALGLLGRLLQQERPQWSVLPMDWRRLRRTHPALLSSPMFTHLGWERAKGRTAETRAEPKNLSRSQLLAAESAERARLLESYLREQVAGALGIAASHLDVHMALNNLGVDSLIAIELKNRVEVELGVIIPVVRFLQGPTVAQLTDLLLEQLDQPAAAAAVTPQQVVAGSGGDNGQASPVPPEDPEQLLSKLDELSNEQVHSLLSAMQTEKESES